LMNVDSTQGLHYEISMPIVSATGSTWPTNCEAHFTVIIRAYDPFGTIIYRQDLLINSPNFNNTLSSLSAPGAFATTMQVAGTITPQDLQNWSTLNMGNGQDPPIAGLEVSISGYVQGLGTVTPPSGVGISGTGCRIVVTAPCGARPGINRPTSIIAYSNVIAGATMTVSGVSNFELIPNPELRKNLETVYGDFVPEELAYVKEVLMNRHQLHIKSVQNYNDYRAAIAFYRELADCTVHTQVSEAFGFGDIARFFKQKVFPALKPLVPAGAAALKGLLAARGAGQFIPLVDAGAGVANNILGSAASGMPVMPMGFARAAGEISTPGGVVAAWVEGDIELLAKHYLALGQIPSCAGTVRDDARLSWASIKMPTFRKSRQKRPAGWMKHVKPVQLCAAPDQRTEFKAITFPTVTEDDGGIFDGMGLYAAVLGDWTSIYPPAKGALTTTADGKHIYGLMRQEPYPFATKCDITIIPVSATAVQANVLQPLKEFPLLTNSGVKATAPPLVAGHSCDGALWILLHKHFVGFYPFVVTGEFALNGGRPWLMPVPSIKLKQPFVRSIGLPLMANDVFADKKVDDLTKLEDF